MSAIFWVATIIMALLAICFAAVPLIRKSRRTGFVGIAIAMPIFATGLYWLVGSPQAARVEAALPEPIQVGSNTSSSTRKSVGSVASLVDGLAERLKQDPDDSKSWLLLARSYRHLNRIPEARDAYNNAAAFGEYDAEFAAMVGSPASENRHLNPVIRKVMELQDHD